MRYFILLCATIFSTAAFASSGGGGISSAPARVVDQNYEAGKNIYAGRSDAYGKVEFCVTDAESSEKVKVSRKSLKAHKGSNVQDFAANLYDCNASDELIAQKLAPHDMNLVLYYLNKRYKLKLEN